MKAGDGGDGFIGFRREKYIPAGGPAGGDGGRGGDIVFIADPSLSTLIDYSYKKHYKAESGGHGQNKNQFGRDGEDLLIRLPVGTVIRHGETGELIADLDKAGQRVIAAEGGSGGRGNTRFATSTRQAPSFAEKGEKKVGFWVDLELKLMADVGLVGYPNAGKSTLISVVSAAKPKIANYPFTTLVPNLGVVTMKDDRSFVIADIPGLIEGAHKGVGLGTDFLRHIERTHIIIHVIDTAGVDGRDPVSDYYKINAELKLFNEKLSELPQLIAANKMELPGAVENLQRLIKAAKKNNHSVFPVSAVMNRGIHELMLKTANVLKQIKQAQADEDEMTDQVIIYRSPEERKSSVDDFTIRLEDQDYVVEGEGLKRFLERLDLNNEETIDYLQRLFDKIGLYRRLRELGIEEGTTVRVEGLEFEYQE